MAETLGSRFVRQAKRRWPAPCIAASPGRELTFGRTPPAARLLPAPAIERLFLAPTSPDALATIIFSSGSTGVPKGVMLTHANIVSNIDAANRVFRLQPDDVMLGVLPFFHSFGFTATLWLPVCIGCAAAYHANPIDAKTIGELAAAYGATILISTPTFCAA